MAGRRDFYDILGVGRNADQDEIQRAYRKLVRTYHPDVNKDPAAEDRFKDISEAYSVLSDPETRRRYDAFGHDFRQVPPDVDPSAYRRARAGAGAGAPGGRRTAGPGVDVDFEDLFGEMFGGRGRGGWGPIPGADQEAELEVTLEEAYRGGKRTITLPGPGGGRRLDVAIPPGVTSGQRIRLAGQGGHGQDGAPPGDLYLVVRMAPHPRYRLDGRDVHVRLPLSPWEAALGATVAVDTPGGDTKLKVPPGTSSGRRLRLRGRGLPNPRGKDGDFLAEARVMVPGTLSDQERELFERLASVSGFDPRGRR
ncbi:DnaJ C-terminal domain-containing protein [Spongiactinospora sp. TRM90649]|uniref:DnaJ C-terminal domain-containing protein n=1 Tax=Spongiactinospora sp. TRM90649 TaxID=3031114 RepID=UPI0023F79A07|nr:DnaJ C-terminal domain-containing protein [Spongiactinospora sp. TRM90649]MDF5757971.1 DnaJ C-terminal domain-containing protein [Spongiactinospora sp. TRM90649]